MFVGFVQLESFYTEPLEFIKSHMPLVGRWQLTPAPVAKEDFWRDARDACEQATSVSREATSRAELPPCVDFCLHALTHLGIWHPDSRRTSRTAALATFMQLPREGRRPSEPGFALKESCE